MFEYIKIDRRIVYYLIIIGFFLSFNHWDNLFIGLANLFFSIIYTIISYFIFLFIFNLVSSFYGLYIYLDNVIAELKILFYKRESYPFFYYLLIILEVILFFIFRYNLFVYVIISIFVILFFYNYIKQLKIKSSKKTELNFAYIKRYNLSYIITIIISIITLGLFVPVIFSMKPIVIEYKRLGRNKNIEVRNDELLRIFLFSTIILWIIYSSIKYISYYSTLLYGFVYYFFNFLFFFTYSSIIPVGILLSPYLSIRRGYVYSNKFIGDILILSNTPFYIASIVTIALLPIFSIIFSPIEVIIFSLAVFSIIWIRRQFDVLTK
ncbi:MAG: hypothetical protein RXQ77_00345 [Candidatus Nanopusillus sp.]